MTTPLAVGDTVIITWTIMPSYFFGVGDIAVITEVSGDGDYRARFENGEHWYVVEKFATCERLHEEDHPGWEVV